MTSLLILPAMTLISAAFVNTGPELGKAEGQCRPNEAGPSFLVNVVGMKDRTGMLKLEVYPDNDADFLQDDNILINAGKVFRRVEMDVPPGGPVTMCVRVPGPGTYSVSLLHDRDRNRKFGWTVDGIGFAGNPRLGWSKPKAAVTRGLAGNGPTRIDIVMNYRHGLGVSPLKEFRTR